MTDEEWAADQPWQRARRLGVPPVEQPEDGRRCCVQWDGHGASWVGTALLASFGSVSKSTQ